MALKNADRMNMAKSSQDDDLVEFMKKSNLKKFENFVQDLYDNVDNSDNFFRAMQNKEHQESLELFLQTINKPKFERELPCFEIRDQMIKNFEAIEKRYIERCLEKEKGRTA